MSDLWGIIQHPTEMESRARRKRGSMTATQPNKLQRISVRLTSRTHSGGRAQRFCGDACRMAHTRKIAAELSKHECYTPCHVIEAARACMGGIDLDPASSAIADEVVQAGRFYSVKDDGLARSWYGRVWMNPPYGGHAPKFAAKLADEISTGNVEQAVVLLAANHMTTKWAREILDFGVEICFPAGRIQFYRPNGETQNQVAHGSVILGVKVDRDLFKLAFKEIGPCR